MGLGAGLIGGGEVAVWVLNRACWAFEFDAQLMPTLKHTNLVNFYEALDKTNIRGAI